MNANQSVTSLARALAGIDTSPGDAATAAWAELLNSTKHGDRHLASALEREYDLLRAYGPDGSERQTRRIEFLLHQMDSGALANAAAWLDDDVDLADDWTDSGPEEIDGLDGDDVAIPNAEMAAIPFSLSARSGADRPRTRGPAGVGALPNDRGYPRGVIYRRLPRLL